MNADMEVLIVEDEVLFAMPLARRLEALGIGIRGIVASGEAAIAAASAMRSGLVVMDISLHGAMDGLEAARRIRSGTELPIIFVTGYEETARRIAEISDIPPLIKPIGVAELAEAIAGVLRAPRKASP
jgi:DNA-binding response OmpR family regulator